MKDSSEKVAQASRLWRFSSCPGVVSDAMNNSYGNRPKTQDPRLSIFMVRGVFGHMGDSLENRIHRRARRARREKTGLCDLRDLGG
jgi:hypothetical protein